MCIHTHTGFSGGSDRKESAYNAGGLGLIPRAGRYPGEGNGYPLQYSCLENLLTEEPGGLQPIALHRVRWDSATNTFTSLYRHTHSKAGQSSGLVRTRWAEKAF